nr:methyltransferase domain-containing protein [Micromonospora sp. DSM 115978]
MLQAGIRSVRRSSSAGPLRLNLGCGLQAPPGWVNIDRSPSLSLDRVPGAKFVLRRAGFLSDGHVVTWPKNILQVDVTKPLPYPTGTVAAIYSSHMLEHIYFDEALALLREGHRVLRPGGLIRLALPDARELARQLLDAPEDRAAAAGLEFTRKLYAGPLNRPTRRQRLVGRFGASAHRWQPSPALAMDMLRQAGFADPRQCEFQVGDLPGLREVEHRRDSFFVESAR